LQYLDYPVVDLWNVDSWFLEMMPKVLDNFKKGLHGFPGHLKRNDFSINEQNIDQGMKDWEAILDRMGYCFTEAGKDMYAVADNYDYRDKMKDEGLDLLKKYFWNLWD
jgi:hypothetical protein